MQYNREIVDVMAKVISFEILSFRQVVRPNQNRRGGFLGYADVAMTVAGGQFWKLPNLELKIQTNVGRWVDMPTEGDDHQFPKHRPLSNEARQLAIEALFGDQRVQAAEAQLRRQLDGQPAAQAPTQANAAALIQMLSSLGLQVQPVQQQEAPAPSVNASDDIPY